MVSARRRRCIQHANVEIGDASSGFLQFVVMAFRGGQRGQVVSVIATRCSLMRPRTQIRKRGRLHVPSARQLLSQHSLTWGEWSSPGELIHPGDSPSISSITSSATKNCVQVGYSQRHSHGWPRPGSYLSRRSRGANWQGSASLRVAAMGCGASTTSTFSYPERMGANAEGHGASRRSLLANAFGPTRALRDAVVVYLAGDGGA